MEHSQVRSCVVSGVIEHDEVMVPVEEDHEDLLILQANAPVTHLYCCGLIIISETINNKLGLSWAKLSSVEASYPLANG